jgi:hypothetical protein
MSFFDTADLDKQAAADKEASESPKFDPAPGDSVDGILTKAEMFTGGQYAPTIVINFRNVGKKAVGGVDEGKIGYLFLPTVLRRKFLEAAPAVGTAFKLRFEGLVSPEGGGNSYKDWTLVTESMGDTSKQDRRMWDAINPANGGVAAPQAQQQSNTGDSWTF